MRFPRKVRILNQSYAVEFDKSMINTNLAGEIIYHEKRIRLNPELKKWPAFEATQTLWHEIIHGYAQESGMNQILSDQAKEMMCESLSRLIIDLTGGKIRQKR